MRKTLACILVGVAVAAACVAYAWRNKSDSSPSVTNGRARNDRSAPTAPPATSRPSHPRLGAAEDAVWAEGRDAPLSTADPRTADVMRAVARSGRDAGARVSVTIDYPANESIFPPEIVAPTFLWHEKDDRVDTWLFDVSWDGGADHIRVLVPGVPPPAGPIDPRCIAPTNEIYRPTSYQASAKSFGGCATSRGPTAGCC